MKPLKILVVEDDPAIRQVLKYQFEANGYAVCTASSCHSALTQCETERPQVLLLDIVLTDELSLDLPKDIHGHPERYGHPVVLAMSGNLSQHQIRKILDRETSKIDAFIDKPFELHDVLKKVHSLLESRK